MPDNLDTAQEARGPLNELEKAKTEALVSALSSAAPLVGASATSQPAPAVFTAQLAANKEPAARQPPGGADDPQDGEAPYVSAQVPNNYINDEEFCKNLERLRELREFLLREAVGMERIGCLSLRALNHLRAEPRPGDGRDPTREEWTQLEKATDESFSVMPEAVRRSYLMRKPPVWVLIAQMGLIGLALASLIAAYYIHDPARSNHNADLRFPLYLIWLVSLGAVGSCAFLVMNALSIQNDATFDLTNNRLWAMRIVLGGLFGLIFALPLGYAAFIGFLDHLCSKTIETFKVEYIILLLAPFVIGFSTTLVITVMNRLIEGVQAIFGRPNSGETSATRSRNTTTGTSGAAPRDAGAAASSR